MEELKEIIGTTQYIVVKFADEQFGIDIQNINTIIRMQRIFRVPKVSSHIKGVINLRGEVIPVVSVRTKMGFDEDVYTKSTRIIIVKVDGGESVGMVVDEVKEVVTMDASQIEKVSYDSKEGKDYYIWGVGKEKDGLISLFDLHNLFADKEEG